MVQSDPSQTTTFLPRAFTYRISISNASYQALRPSQLSKTIRSGLYSSSTGYAALLKLDVPELAGVLYSSALSCLLLSKIQPEKNYL
jgi:hypothetical protein